VTSPFALVHFPSLRGSKIEKLTISEQPRSVETYDIRGPHISLGAIKKSSTHSAAAEFSIKFAQRCHLRRQQPSEFGPASTHTALNIIRVYFERGTSHSSSSVRVRSRRSWCSQVIIDFTDSRIQHKNIYLYNTLARNDLYYFVMYPFDLSLDSSYIHESGCQSRLCTMLNHYKPLSLSMYSYFDFSILFYTYNSYNTVTI
jgi:hypothetical protein